MRVNVYTEELLSPGTALMVAEIVTADYVSSRTGQPMTNYGLRIYLKSAPELHYIPGRDDDRSAITFWCGAERKRVYEFWDMVGKHSLKEMHPWRPVPSAIKEAEQERAPPRTSGEPRFYNE